MSRFQCAALLALFLSAAACGSDTPTTPTTPTPDPVTDNFAGTLTVNGATTYAFNVNAQGPVYAALNSLSDASAIVGLSLGIYNTASGTCTTTSTHSNDQAVQGATLTGSATGVGTLCVRIYDVGRLGGAVDYSIAVTHY
jgi:hypothetical protein